MDLCEDGWLCDNAAGRYENESMSGLTLKFGNWPIEEDEDNYVVGSSTTPYLIGISAVAKSDFAINGWTITNHPSVTDMAGWFKSTFSNFDIVISEKERAVQVDLPLYRIEVPESPSSCPLGASVGMQRYPTHKYNVSIVISDMSISVSIGTYGSQFIEGCNAD